MSAKRILLGGSLVLGSVLSFLGLVVFLSSGMTSHLISLRNLGGFLFLSFRQAAFFIPLYLLIGVLLTHLSVVNMRMIVLWNLSGIPFLTLAWLLHTVMDTTTIVFLSSLGRDARTLVLLGFLFLEIGGMFFLSRSLSTDNLDEIEVPKVLLLPASSSVTPADGEWERFRSDTRSFIHLAEENLSYSPQESSPQAAALEYSPAIASSTSPVVHQTVTKEVEHPEESVTRSEEPWSEVTGILSSVPKTPQEKTVHADPIPAPTTSAKPNAAHGEAQDYHIPENIFSYTEEDRTREPDSGDLKQREVLETTLGEFGIEARVIGVRRGSTVTRFEVLPAPGIKLARISNLADNLALRLAAESIRIVAPIPGKEAVGIDIPNKKRSLVRFGDMIRKKEFHSPRIHIPIVLGSDITGNARIFDLTRMPHLLIAGATGSGKSVCVNTIICSILYRCPPDMVKFILIDPKIVELSFYNNIPHLLTRVINKASQAFQVLQYCICEMEHRYSQLESQGVRDIHAYNVKMEQQGWKAMPYIVVIVDEFADLMIGSGKDLESTVARLTAMSRAVGIHLVLATQRPSTDVITGLIKANIPSRIAFMVASKIDSRIIIDGMGAEKLLGRGDMLFTSPSSSFPVRMQGAYLSEQEVEQIVDAAKEFGPPEYLDEEIFIEDEETSFSDTAGGDPLIKEATEIVRQYKKTSVSFLQRKLRIGYNRAARLMEELEHIGVVGPLKGNKPREILSPS